MLRWIFWRWASSVLLLTPLYCATSHALESPSIAPQMQEQNEEEFFIYALRTGDSLNGVARIFRVPVEQLIQVNHITDPSRLRVGYPLKIPNMFTQQIAQLRRERDQLAVAHARARQDMQENRQTLTTLQAEIQSLEEQNALQLGQATAAWWWRRATFLLAGLLTVGLGWGMLARRNQENLAKEVAALTQYNEALTVAKEKYRQAAAQIELRYQKLYRLGEGTPAKFIQDGVAFIERVFNEGSVRLEQLLAAIQLAQENSKAGQRAGRVESLSQSWRDFLHRHRLKYHEA